MAGSSGAQAGPSTELYARTTLTTTSPITYAALIGATNLVLAANSVYDPESIGDQEQSGNLIEYTPYGAQTTKSIAGAASLGEFTFSFYLDNSNTLHQTLLDLGAGDDIECAVVTTSGTAAITVDYIRGEVSSTSKRTPIDSPQVGEVGVALSQAVKRVNA